MTLETLLVTLTISIYNSDTNSKHVAIDLLIQ
jgi:hypothetical protein